jgi:hypothetical protein
MLLATMDFVGMRALFVTPIASLKIFYCLESSKREPSVNPAQPAIKTGCGIG